MKDWSPGIVRIIGIACGLMISGVDNLAFGGEVSPILIVMLLLLSAMILGTIGRQQAWILGICIGAWVPMAHLLKHLAGLPDTLQPNSYGSIAKLGVFVLLMSVGGTYAGVLVRRLFFGNSKPGDRSALKRTTFR